MADNLVRLSDVLEAVQAVADRHAAMDEHHAELAANAHAELANGAMPADSAGGDSDG